MGKTLRWMGNRAAGVSEYALSELALPVAAATMAGQGNYFERVYSGVSEVAKALNTTVGAYVTNAGVRDTMNSGAMHILELLGNTGHNIAERPVETGLTALATYVGMKAIPKLSGIARQKLTRRAEDNDLRSGLESRIDE